MNRHHPACPWWRLGFSETKPCPMCAILARIDTVMDEG